MNDKQSSPLSIVMIILAAGGILAAITIPHIIDKYFSTTAAKELRKIAIALETYYIDNACYPPAVDKTGNFVFLPGTDEHCSAGYLPSALTTPVVHMKKIPFDPYGPSKPKDWARTFRYASRDIFYYILCSRGPDEDFDMVVEDYVLSASGEVFLFLSHLGPGTAVEYDPSNGIFSNGDVFRTGP